MEELVSYSKNRAKTLSEFRIIAALIYFFQLCMSLFRRNRITPPVNEIIPVLEEIPQKKKRI